MRTQDVVAAVRRFVVVVARCIRPGRSGGSLLASRTAPTYMSEARLLFSVSGGNSATDLNQAATYLAREMTSCVQISTSDRVLDPAAQRLRPALTAGESSAPHHCPAPTNTVLLSVVADAEQPELRLNGRMPSPRRYAAPCQSLSPTMQNGAKTIQAGVIQTAKPPAASAGVSLPLGVGLGTGWPRWEYAVPLSSRPWTRVRDAATLRRLVNTPVLASLEGGRA